MDIPIRQYEIMDIEDAYRRWKHFVCFDNSYLLYRRHLAEFECLDLTDEERDTWASNNLTGKTPLEKRLNLLLARLGSPKIKWSDWEDRIRPFPVPKKIRDIEDETEEIEEKKGNNSTVDKNSNIVIHNAQPDTIEVEKVTWLINCPVEVHLLAVLWILQNGKVLQEEFKKSNYGNLLVENLEKGSQDNGLSLFVPYHINYQRWRDRAIKQAKMLVSDGDDVLMIGLDIRDYYHSVELGRSDYQSKNTSLKQNYDDRLGNFLFEISQFYFTNHFPEITKSKKKAFGLPIGLASSSILANSYLTEFDQSVRVEMQPSYYGRYVDDILIVLRCPEKCKTEEDVRKESEKYLNRVLTENDKDCNRTLKKTKSLSIQQKKVLLYYFDANEPLTLLEKFIRELRENSSEYRFLPTEEDAKATFEEAAFSIHYEGSKTKLRSIRDFTPNRFGVSSFLAKLIFGAIRVNKVHNKDSARQVYTFFRGRRAIEMFNLWEKAFTYMVVTKDKAAFKKLSQNIQKAIVQLEKHDKASFSIDALKDSLNDHLLCAQHMALALHPKLETGIGQELAIQFRRSNLVRHSYVNYPLVNFLQSRDMNEDWSYIDFDWQDLGDGDSIENVFRNESWKFSPRFVHFHELVLIWVDRLLDEKKGQNGFSLPYNYLKTVFSIFYALNYRRTKPTQTSNPAGEAKPQDGSNDMSDMEELMRKQYFEYTPPEDVSNPKIAYISVSPVSSLQTVRIALANLEVSTKNIKDSFLNKPNISIDRRDDLYSILNQISKQKGADLLVLPEVSVPYRWVSLLCDRSRSENMAAVFGLEHWIKGKYAYNFLVTLLPVKINTRRDNVTEEYHSAFDAVIPIFRIKNHYSPGEIKELEGHHLEIPKVSPAFYHLFNWQGLHFTTFNCFELADISHRSAFRSKIDVLVACEFNHDVIPSGKWFAKNHYSPAIRNLSVRRDSSACLCSLIFLKKSSMACRNSAKCS